MQQEEVKHEMGNQRGNYISIREKVALHGAMREVES